MGYYLTSSVSTLSTSFQTQLDAKSNKPTVVKTSLSASGWDTTDSVYSLESLYPSTSYDVSIEPNGATITSAQYEAWSKAQILGNPDENIIRALGTIPTVDIPVVLTVTSMQLRLQM